MRRGEKKGSESGGGCHSVPAAAGGLRGTCNTSHFTAADTEPVRADGPRRRHHPAAPRNCVRRPAACHLQVPLFQKASSRVAAPLIKSQTRGKEEATFLTFPSRLEKLQRGNYGSNAVAGF